MDRKLYRLPFQEEYIPQWICPTCNKGVLQLKKDTFLKSETSDSKLGRSHPEWEPEWLQYTFSCQLECSLPCEETIICIGTGTVEEGFSGYDEDGFPDFVLTDFYRPKYFQPSLKIFSYPKGTFSNVKDELNHSFELFFCSPPSAANHVRIAIENLLTNLGVKRFRINNNKRAPIFLHNRIESLPRKYQDLKDILLAIKWLGNAGSHERTTITIDDVMDAYEMLAVVLEDLFDNKKKIATKKAKEINKRKGPRKK